MKADHARYEDVMANHIRNDPALARSTYESVLEELSGGAFGSARMLVAQLIKGTLGYAALARRTGLHEKSLIRMFGMKGNPHLDGFVKVLVELRTELGIKHGATAAVSLHWGPPGRKPPRKRKARSTEKRAA